MKKFFKNNNKIIIIAVIVLALAMSSVTIIKSGEVGVRIRFGKVVNTKTSEGINIKIPLIETIKKMNVRVQKTEVQTSSSSKDLQE